MHLLSAIVIVFTLMVKMLMPIAHASNASDGDKRFLASLCSGDKIVFIEIPIVDSDDKESTTVQTASNHCPLCNFVEEDVIHDVSDAQSALFVASASHLTYTSTKQLPASVLNAAAIRAPPRIS